MCIKFLEESRSFYLHSKNTTYSMMVGKRDYLFHIYYGKKVENQDLSYALRYKEISFSPNPPDSEDREFSLNISSLEYPAYGFGDFRVPAINVMDYEGYEGLNAKYRGYKILKGNPKIAGLPSTFSSGEDLETLEIELYDEVIEISVKLYYTVFYEKDIISKHVVILNEGDKGVKLEKAHSFSLEFNDAGFEIIALPGAYGRERYMERNKLSRGIVAIDSKRGASSHQFNPSIALVSKECNENFGEAYGMTLVYSGSFSFDVEVSEVYTTRVTGGINPWGFCWNLEPGASFSTPEALITFSSTGLGNMSRNFHDLFRENLIKRPVEFSLPPVLINSWEGCYFNFNDESILSLAREASKVGIELFVMDDGWFGKRNNDKTSLGDWYVNTDKITMGLKNLVNEINSLGMKFGLWVEPEMVSPNSELYVNHPEWCIGMKGRMPSISRNQLVLDLSREDVRDYIVDKISNILSSSNISYVKWDFNRHITDIGSNLLDKNHQGEVLHRYVLGLYEVMEKLTSKFKNILFESCSGGGGRFDAGMLYYMPQVWTSDNMDPIDRIFIHYGTSLVYPPSVMGAHIATVPNHLNNRVTDFKTRGDVALFGAFGYELDVVKLGDEEKTQIKNQVEFYKAHGNLIFKGDYYRILNPHKDNASAWAIVSKDKTEALVCYVQIMSKISTLPKRIMVPGLCDDLIYVINDGEKISGSALKNVGLNLEFSFGDFKSQLFYLKSM